METRWNRPISCAGASGAPSITRAGKKPSSDVARPAFFARSAGPTRRRSRSSSQDPMCTSATAASTGSLTSSRRAPGHARPAHQFHKGCSGNSRVTVGSCLSGFARAARLGPARVPSVSGARTGARLFLLKVSTESARTALARASRSSDRPPAVSPTYRPTRPGSKECFQAKVVKWGTQNPFPQSSSLTDEPAGSKAVSAGTTAKQLALQAATMSAEPIEGTGSTR